MSKAFPLLGCDFAPSSARVLAECVPRAVVPPLLHRVIAPLLPPHTVSLKTASDMALYATDVTVRSTISTLLPNSDFQNVHVDADGIAYLSIFPQLTSLSLHIHIDEDSARVIGTFLQLESLALLFCGGGDAILRHIVPLQGLTTLSLAHCHDLDERGMEHVGKLLALTSLDLVGCDHVTPALLSHIVTLPALRELGVMYTEGGALDLVPHLEIWDLT